MTVIDTVIIGGGQAGLAASRLLTKAQHEHVILERGRVGERWLSATWDSLRLLTPNWMTRLPHWGYSGAEPDGFMTARQVAAFLSAYGRSFHAPMQSNTAVERVRLQGARFEVETNHEAWQANNVIIATGWTDRPAIPSLAANLEPSIEQLAPASYRNPGQLPDGAVLVVGASASGVQLADELRRDGRMVYLSVGRHTRMTRRYRGRDIFWWLDQIGSLDRTIDEVRSPADARREPSMQLIGRGDGINVDLRTLASTGVVLVGRLSAIESRTTYFDDDLHATMEAADERLCRTLEGIDRYIASNHLAEQEMPPARPGRRKLAEPPTRMNLHKAGVSAIIWATGHRRDYHWLDVPVLGTDGELMHRYGVTAIPGLYVLGQRFQRTRRSAFLDGVGTDAAAITQHLLQHTRAH